MALRPASHPPAILLLLILLLPASAIRAFNPAQGDFSKEHPSHIRVLTWNMQERFPLGTAAQSGAQDRILIAINPDIIAFQEIPPTATPGQITARLNNVLGGPWYLHLGFIDNQRNALASRFPLTQTRVDSEPPSSRRGITMGLVQLPREQYPFDLFVMNIHFQAFTGEIYSERRQRHADALIAWTRELRTPGGLAELPFGTPIIATGDFNLMDNRDPVQTRTMLDGSIQDTATFGRQSAPDWDGGPFADAWPLNPYSLWPNTWNSNTANPTQRFDRLFHQPSNSSVAHAFVLNTFSMDAPTLALADLQSADTFNGSDHLPFVVDLVLPGAEPVRVAPGQIYFTEIMPRPGTAAISQGQWFELYNSGTAPVDIRGWIVRNGSGAIHRIASPAPVVVPAKGTLVIGARANQSLNGGVPVQYAYGESFGFDPLSDSIEIFNPTRKIDGARWGGGPEGRFPPSRDWGEVFLGTSREMKDDYRFGATDRFGNSIEEYNGFDLGTPGSFNSATPSSLAGSSWAIR